MGGSASAGGNGTLPCVKVGVLGSLQVQDDARTIEIKGARLRALLIRLAAGAGGWVPAGQLIEALWGDDPPGDELNALQSLIARLRRALPEAGLIESAPTGYRLAVPADAVDAVRFERLVEQARVSARDGRAVEAFAELSLALGLWRGSALVDLPDAPYAVAWARSLDQLRLSAVEDRAEAGLRLGRHAELIPELEPVAAAEPLRERLHELLIRALAGAGRRREALAVHDRLRQGLTDELGLDLPARLQELHLAVLRDDPGLRPAAWRPEAASLRRRSNLRAPLTSFVGREDDVAQVRRLLAATRLVTLIGTGGAGKTRLAAEISAGLEDLGSDGVWMVELAPLSDPDDIAAAVLGALGSREPALLEHPAPTYRDTVSRLVELLGENDVLVIMDNCEHLLDGAARLAEQLLGQCPRLRVLATSREPLGIVGESLWPVPPLSSPQAGDGLDELLQASSVRLFAERAALVRPGFTVGAGNGVAVGEICRRLDGLPLAIELAAARLRNLPVEAVAARLGERFELLAEGNRTALPRHRTLRAVVDWSWELLTPAERRLAERLSVFAGGASATAAEAVCGPGLDESGLDDVGRSPVVVADLLAALLDKSLLVAVESAAPADAEPRYRMLETIREFAAGHLAARGETVPLRTRHRQYFLSLAERAEPNLRRTDQVLWMDRLSAEHDNLLATLRFAIEVEDAESAVRLSAALCWYWTLMGRHDEAATWLGQALAVPGPSPEGAYLLVALVHAVSSAVVGGSVPDPEQVEALMARVGRRELADRHPLLALAEPGVAMVSGDGAGARAATERNLAHPDPWARATLWLLSAMAAENEGDIELMEECLPQALDGFRRLGDRWGIGTTVGVLGGLRGAQGDVEGSIEALEEARVMMGALHAWDDEAYSLIRIGLQRLRLPDLEGARRDIEAGLALPDAPLSSAFGRYARFALARYLGDQEEARRQVNAANAVLERVRFAPPQLRGIVLCGLATLDVLDHDLDRARENLRAALRCAQDSQDMPAYAMVATGVADLLMAEHRPGPAAVLLGATVRLRGADDPSDPDVRRIRTEAEAALGAEEFARGYDQGRALTRPQALAQVEIDLSPSQEAG